MAPRKPLDSQAAGIMLVLCLIWGLQQVALKAAAGDVAPLRPFGHRRRAARPPYGLARGTHPSRRRDVRPRPDRRIALCTGVSAGWRRIAPYLGFAHGGPSLHGADLRCPRPALQTAGRKAQCAPMVRHRTCLCRHCRDLRRKGAWRRRRRAGQHAARRPVGPALWHRLGSHNGCRPHHQSVPCVRYANIALPVGDRLRSSDHRSCRVRARPASDRQHSPSAVFSSSR